MSSSSSSAGYASRLSPYTRKGVCGLPESLDTPRQFTLHMDQLVHMIQAAQGRVVILTGAGISTSAGIPDFRGPRGIWTVEQQQQQKKTNKNKRGRSSPDDDEGDDRRDNHLTRNGAGKKRSRSSNKDYYSNPSPTPPRALLSDWSQAKPTLTHYAITKLIQDDHHFFSFCVTQNVDGLHRRSGLSRNHHAVLHGCAFTEQCDVCGTEYFHNVDLGGMSFAKTGRTCTSLLVPQGSCCGGALRDTLLDWNDELPQDDLNRATMQCQNADWVLCLGTSLRIEPAGSLPTLAKKGFVIVNLQPTPYDGKAALVIRARVDQVMKELLQRLCECNMDDPAQLEAVVNSDRPVERVWTPANSSSSTTTAAISALHPRKDSK